MDKNEFIKKIIIYKYIFIIFAILLTVIGTIILATVLNNKNITKNSSTVIVEDAPIEVNYIDIPMWETEDETLFIDEKEEKQQEYDYSSTDFVEKLIVIDAGHGGFDCGAIGKFSGVHEDDINLAIALKLKSNFENNGYSVIMTREDENAIGSTKMGDMGIRRRIIEQAKGQLTVSIHMNFFTSSNVSGPQVFYFESSNRGKTAAALIQDNLDNDLNPAKKRKITDARYYILRSGSSPAVLVECGFLSNKNEEYLLKQESYQDKIARAVFKGAHAYIESENNS
jgi:N-acetylmuramoyl-L-alanine amidase